MVQAYETGQQLRGQSACPVCAEQSASVVAQRDGKTGQPLLTVACQACGLGRIDPMPDTQALVDWYARSYRQEYKQAVQPALRHVLRAGRNALDRWWWLQSQDAWVREGASCRQTLDIGSSSGEFVYLMQHLGFEARGVEPHQGYAAYARQTLGIDVHNASVQDWVDSADTPAGDLVTMFHVLEHLNDPIGVLRQLARRLGPQGKLFIEVPNAARPCAPHSMFFRAHVLYFTGATLRQTLAAAGWQVLAHNPDGSGNLMVLAQPASGAQAPAPAPALTLPAQPLVTAQRQRRWAPYLLGELRAGRPVHKWRKRQEEKATAARFADGRALLDALYAHASAPGSGVADAVPGGRTFSV